jgi:ribosomal protein L17
MFIRSFVLPNYRTGKKNSQGGSNKSHERKVIKNKSSSIFKYEHIEIVTELSRKNKRLK